MCLLICMQIVKQTFGRSLFSFISLILYKLSFLKNLRLVYYVFYIKKNNFIIAAFLAEKQNILMS